MKDWNHSARRYPRGLFIRDEGSKADRTMFVLCSKDTGATMLAASCDPSIVLQTLGGAEDVASLSVRGTFEYALRLVGVNRVIVCGHAGCGAERAADAAIRQCRRLASDSVIGRLLRDYGVSARALWFDAKGDVCTCAVSPVRFGGTGRAPGRGEKEDARCTTPPAARPPSTA